MILRILFFIFIFCTFFSIAQSDSNTVIIDTVYQYEAPVVIKKEIYLPSTDTNSQKNWLVGLGIGLSQQLKSQPNDSLTLKWESATFMEVLLKRRFRQIELSLGLSFFQVKTKAILIQQYDIQRQRMVQTTDTLDVYYQIVNGTSTPVYVTEQKTITESYKETNDTLKTTSTSIQYLQIPIRIAYQLKWKSWYMSPGLGLMANIPLQNNGFVKEIAESKPNIVWFGSVHLALGKKLTNRWQTELCWETSKSLSNVTEYKGIKNQQWMSASLRILYSF